MGDESDDHSNCCALSFLLVVILLVSGVLIGHQLQLTIPASEVFQKRITHQTTIANHSTKLLFPKYDETFNRELKEKYFGKMKDQTKAALSEMGAHVQLLNVYELNSQINVNHMWLSSIYDQQNQVFWVVTRTYRDASPKWIISVYKDFAFQKRLTKDKMLSSEQLTNQQIRLEEIRLFYLNQFTILAAVHNRGVIAVVNFSALIISPTKKNNFTQILSTNNKLKFYSCQLIQGNTSTERHKNWSPLILNHSLHFVIKHEPLTVVRCANICRQGCVVIYQEALPLQKHSGHELVLRGGSQYVSVPRYPQIYIGFLHSHIATPQSPHKSIYRGFLSVLNITEFEVLYVSEPLNWGEYELKWQESSPAGIVGWSVDTLTREDVMYICWCIGGIKNGGEYHQIITKQSGFYPFVVDGLKYGFDRLYVHHPYWEERIKEEYLDFFDVRRYEKNPTGDR